MPQALRRDDQSAEPRLGRADWISAAMEVLIAEGVNAVRITRLADRMAVTRGSFYWHFKDREDLLAALIRRWEAQNTDAVAAAVGQAPTLDHAIIAFFNAWLIPERFDARLEDALRAWAKADADICEMVAEADRTRIGDIAAMFERFGFGDTEALIRARVLYFSQIGFYALTEHEPLSERSPYLEAYFHCFTGRALSPKIAAAQRAKFEELDHGAG
jgi:AcrR family transcriptional regulator